MSLINISKNKNWLQIFMMHLADTFQFPRLRRRSVAHSQSNSPECGSKKHESQMQIFMVNAEYIQLSRFPNLPRPI